MDRAGETAARRRRARSQRTREAVLLAAAEVFERRGFAAASLSEITQTLGMTKGALYFHFPSKEAVAVAVVEEFYARNRAGLARLREQHDSPLAVVVAIAFESERLLRDDVLVRAGSRLAREGAAAGVALPAPYVRPVAWVRELLEEARAAGELRPEVDLQGAAETVVAGNVGADLLGQALTGRRDVIARVRSFWRLALPGLTPPEHLERLRAVVEASARQAG